MSASLSSSPNEITGHGGHPKHKLILAGKEAMLQTCEYCEDQILNRDSSYKCTHCKGKEKLTKYFHGACLNAKSNFLKAYPFKDNVKLNFSPRKEGRINCTACRYSVRGIMYTGSYKNENYHLHPYCIDLPRNLKRESLELKLCCIMQTNMECHFCRMNANMGWCYAISSGELNYACHVHCLKKRLAEHHFSEMVPVKLPSRIEYFESLDRGELRKVKRMLVDKSLKAILLGLDLMLSAFMGIPAPIDTVLSVTLELLSAEAVKIYKAAGGKHRN